LVECLLVTACCMASNPDIPQKSYMGDISKEAANTFVRKKIYKKILKYENCIRYMRVAMLQKKMLFH
jgi:hypothetical protein